MLTSEAQVRTDRPSRYLVQLCRHANQMVRGLRHRPRSHDGHASPEVRHVEWSDTDGVVSLNWGQWSMTATPSTLTLRAQAADADRLRQIQDLVAARLEKIGRRDNLKVSWQPTEPPTGQPADAIGTAYGPTVGPAARRRRRTTFALAAVAVLAIAVHLGLGGAALAGSRWTGLAVYIVVAVVVLKVVGVAVIALRRWRRPAKALSGAGSPPTSRFPARATRRARRLRVTRVERELREPVVDGESAVRVPTPMGG